jgi:glycosyltransferase involved in cell wall biosynthesis
MAYVVKSKVYLIVVLSMLLSIIVPLFNKADSIKSTIESVLTQDFQDYEIIVVDDGSTDNSIEVVRSINSERIAVYKKENGGPSSARNFGVKKAQGEWLLFLDADDRLTHGALQLVNAFVNKKKRVDVFTFNLYLEYEGEITLFVPSHANGRVRHPFMSLYLEKIFPRTGNMVCKREVFLEEPYDESLHRYEDAENNFRLMERYRFYASDKPLMVYNQNTLAASHGRENKEEDFCCVMHPKGRPIFQQMLMYRLYKKDTCVNYPELAPQLYQEFSIKRIERWDRRILKYKQAKRRVRSILRGMHLLH